MFAQFASNFQFKPQIVDLYLPYWYFKLLVFDYLVHYKTNYLRAILVWISVLYD